MIDNFKTDLVLRVAAMPHEEILKAMGYQRPTSANLERLQSVLDDPEFGLTNGGFDFKYSSEGFLRALCVVTGMDMALADHRISRIKKYLDAVAWATKDPQNPGNYLRPHIEKNLKQHRAFLEQVGEGSELHQSMIKWFKTLPVYLDPPDFRVVHACWHPVHISAIANYTDPSNRLLQKAWVEASQKGSKAYEAIETLLKGLEIPLPGDHHFFDKDKNKRTNIRAEWWRRGDLTYRDLAMVPGDVIQHIPHEPVESDVLPGYDGEKPVFVGHYWMSGEPKPLSDHIARLDYSVAGDCGGKLCAYRFNGEQLLSASKFVWVDS